MATIQYTIRGITPETDARLRRLASLRKQSLNQVVLERISSSNELSAAKKSHRTIKSKVNKDFDDLFGSITPLAPDVEAALSSQRSVNPKDWQ